MNFLVAILVIFMLGFSACSSKKDVKPSTCKLRTEIDNNFTITYEYNNLDLVSKITHVLKNTNKLYSEDVYEYNSSNQRTKRNFKRYDATGATIAIIEGIYQYVGQNIAMKTEVAFEPKTSSYSSEKEVYTYENNAVVKIEYYSSSTAVPDNMYGYNVFTNDASGKHIKLVQFVKNGMGDLLQSSSIRKYYYRANNTLETTIEETEVLGKIRITQDNKYDEKERPVSLKDYIFPNGKDSKLSSETVYTYTEGSEGLLKKEIIYKYYSNSDVVTKTSTSNYTYDCPK